MLDAFSLPFMQRGALEVLVLAVAAGERSLSEQLGHQEFILTYKAFDPIGPECLPMVARA